MMKNKKIYKIGLALLIAIAFLLPTGSMANVGDPEAGDGQRYSVTENNGQIISPLAWWNSKIYLTDMTTLMGVMPEGCYDLTVEIVKENDTDPPVEDCDIKLFLDIWKHGAAPNIELYCTDFEDPWDIYNNWNSIDSGTTGSGDPGDGAVDTFTLTDVRSHSPSYSFRCTIFDDHYMGNQEDYLQTYVDFDGEEYGQVEVIFWHYCDGERITITSGNYQLEDYGQVQYAYSDTGPWTDIGDAYWSTDGWEEVSVNVTDSTGETGVWLRWKWISGTTIQNEGWFIDDVCVYGREDMGWGARVFDTYSPHIINVSTDCMEYTFPEQYCFDEGEYSIRVWALTETHKCISQHPQDDPFWFNFTVGDALDIAMIDNNITNFEDPFYIGDDLAVTCTVENQGTLDATDVAVTFSIKEQITNVLFQEFFENLAEFPPSYDDWVNWEVSNWDGPDLFHIDDALSLSPTHSMACYEEPSQYYPAGCFQAIKTFDIDMESYEDVIVMDLEFDIQYKLGIDDAVVPVMFFPGHALFLTNTTVWLDGDSGGWQHISYADWLKDSYLDGGDRTIPEEFILEATTRGWDATECGLGWGILDPDAFDNTHGLLAGPWSGFAMENVKWYTVNEGAEKYKEIIVIPELKAASPTDSAENETIEFTWADMPTGDFVEVKSIPDDDNNDNNQMSQAFEVVVEVDSMDEEEVETMDLTIGDDNHWHVTTSGYDNYLWCGEEDIGTYGPDYNDVLLFAPSGDPSLDMAGLGTFNLKFDDFEDVEGKPFDWGMIEINPHVSDPGSQWYLYSPEATNYTPIENFEGVTPPAVPGTWTTVNYAGATNWISVAYGWAGMEPLGSPTQYVWIGGPAPYHTGLFTPFIDTTSSPLPFVQLDVIPMTLYDGNSDFWINTYSGGTALANYEETLYDLAAEQPLWTWNGGNPKTFTFDPRGYSDPTQVYIEFEYVDVASGYYIGIDDVQFIAIGVPPPAQGVNDWTPMEYDMNPGLFVNTYTGDTFETEIGSAFTDDMGVRFRFVSDPGWEYRGWLVDNIEITGSTIFELDLCDDLDNFILDYVHGGDWWFEDTCFGGWTCKDQIMNKIPHDVDCALVWDTSVPQALAATLHFYHDYDLETGYDFCYVEFSNDGGTSWVAPVGFSGSGAGDYEIDMTAFIGENVLVRWRVNTDASGLSDYYSVRNATITAKIDTIAPVTIGTLSGTMIYGWYSSPVTFTATATDDVSGVAATYYSIDGGSTLTYTGPITISVNGEHYVEYWSVDNVGNEEIHHTTPTFKIDTGAAPSVAITAPTDGLYLFGNKLLSLSGKIIIIGGFTVEATASDAGSGVYRVQFELDGTIFGEATSAPYSAYCGEKHTGAGTITVTAEDFTGNTASASISVTYFKFL